MDNFIKLRTTCGTMPQGYYAVPPVQSDQPDLQPRSDKPQIERV